MRVSKWFPAAWVAVACAAAQAQALPGGVALGMTLPEVQQAAPALQRVAHPSRLAGGLVGSWSGGTIELAGVALTPTFFFADGQLQRVEYLARDGGGASHGALLAWARAAWGPELAANDAGRAYASWTSEDRDVYLQLASTGRGEQLRLVVKRRVVKDAGEL